MKVRPINAINLKKYIKGLDVTLPYDEQDKDDVIRQVCSIIDNWPTLTPLNEWINRDECLPEWQADVLVRYANGKIDISWVDSVGAFQFETLYGRVTHWMPLPTPPDRRPPEGEA